jgi:hypothetical protein
MAHNEDITIDQGADVSIELHLVTISGSPKDLANHTVAAKMKKSYNSDSASTYEFTTGIASPASDGIATLSMTNAQTDLIKAGRYLYDVEISYFDSDSASVVERVLEGKILVNPSVTR